jgi:hypothetical protein
MTALHPKPKGEEPECYCGDICKIEVSGDKDFVAAVLDV